MVDTERIIEYIQIHLHNSPHPQPRFYNLIYWNGCRYNECDAQNYIIFQNIQDIKAILRPSIMDGFDLLIKTAECCPLQTMSFEMHRHLQRCCVLGHFSISSR
ncbi:hypothetical protein RF11_11386 [Thelohanellus kitauei]|uniref:Uncharacterized protein n=1 Tax=Thelohanellus kitauei TaxID=669202 RepID=A0A0C2JYR0_THEKT|nr:hypothetical protein RF11_11386 [Thelohanellus kitauei]